MARILGQPPEPPPPNTPAVEPDAEYQTLLAADPTRLLRNLAQQLLIYSTGRDVAFADRTEIAAIIARTQKAGGGIRTLLHELVQSPLFQTR